MVLFSIVGELGSGKTLALAYLSWHNWYHRNRIIYSNFHLYGFPFNLVRSIPQLEKMKSGVFAGDELWLYIDSWGGKTKKQKLISSILLKSRKRDITIIFTTQSISQINKRIRDVCDFISYPMISVDNSYTRIEIFRGPRASIGTRINPPIYFNNEPIFACFNTYEEIPPIKEEDIEPKEMFLPILQNPAWIRYLKKEKGITTRDKIIRYSNQIQKVINPEGITSEDQREHEEFETI